MGTPAPSFMAVSTSWAEASPGGRHLQLRKEGRVKVREMRNLVYLNNGDFLMTSLSSVYPQRNRNNFFGIFQNIGKNVFPSFILYLMSFMNRVGYA